MVKRYLVMSVLAYTVLLLLYTAISLLGVIEAMTPLATLACLIVSFAAAAAAYGMEGLPYTAPVTFLLTILATGTLACVVFMLMGLAAASALSGLMIFGMAAAVSGIVAVLLTVFDKADEAEINEVIETSKEKRNESDH